MYTHTLFFCLSLFSFFLISLHHTYAEIELPAKLLKYFLSNQSTLNQSLVPKTH